MANINLLTTNSKVSKVEQDFYAPVALLPITGTPISEIFCFLSRIDPWYDDLNPVPPTEDQAYLKQVFKNIFALKQITSNDISPVIQRIDWTSGHVYDYYLDTINMFATDSNGLLLKKFYIRNKYNQVFKCLWNNGGGPSTQEPIFQPGTYGTDNIYTGSDGYKWKYIYTIETGIRTKFMDANWMPIPVGQNTPGPTFDTAGNQIGAWCGDVEVINIINPGSGYSNVVPVIVNITGDGIGANATAIVSNTGTISDVIVNNPGTNYNWCNVTFTSAQGGGAVAVAPTSPIGGHGFDPVSELGCTRSMFVCSFQGSEGGVIPTNIDYRQVGILINPVSQQSYPYPANGSIYSATTDLIVAPGFGVYESDEILYQGVDLANATYAGTILNFDVSTNIIKLINIRGTPTLNFPVFGATTTTVRTLLTVSNPDILLPSGYLSYIENRSGVQRSPDGTELFKFILGY